MVQEEPEKVEAEAAHGVREPAKEKDKMSVNAVQMQAPDRQDPSREEEIQRSAESAANHDHGGRIGAIPHLTRSLPSLGRR